MDRRKPSLPEWLFALGMLALFLFRGPVMRFAAVLPSFLERALDMFSKSPVFGIGLLIGYGIRWGLYQSMPVQKQRDIDRQGKDEREIAIRGKAAFLCLEVTWIGLIIPMFILYDRGLVIESLMICGAILASALVYVLAVRWFQKRM